MLFPVGNLVCTLGCLKLQGMEVTGDERVNLGTLYRFEMRLFGLDDLKMVTSRKLP